jgi:glycosyltransferase involved in cell wall biosynthesis
MSDLSIRNTPIISVVIPVFNDEGILLKCLNALREQTLPKDDFEVIVVDNGSRNDVATFLSKDFPEVRCVIEKTPGSYHARNTGVRESRGAYLAFTDADCIPSPNWLSEALNEFKRNADLAYLAGNILVFPCIADKPNLAERFEMRNAFRQNHYLEAAHYGATANVVVAKSLIDEQVGWFDESRGRGDDTHWGQAVWQAGLNQRFCGASIVYHPARNSVKELVRKIRREHGRAFFWECDGLTRSARLKVLLKHLRRNILVPRYLLKWYLGTAPYTKRQFIETILVGSVLHYAAQIEKIRLTFGGNPLPR